MPRLSSYPQKLPCPANMDRRVLERLMAFFKTRSYDNQTVVFSPGDPGNRIYFVIEGRVQVLTPVRNGRDLFLGSFIPGEFVGEAGLFLPPRTRKVYLRTTEPSVLAEIDSTELSRLLEGPNGPLAMDAFAVMHAFGANLSRQMLAGLRRSSGLALLNVQSRIWEALQDLCEEPGAMTHPNGIQVKVSRRDLARMVGCSREMAGRIILKLVEEGKMSAHGKTMVIYPSSIKAPAKP